MTYPVSKISLSGLRFSPPPEQRQTAHAQRKQKIGGRFGDRGKGGECHVIAEGLDRKRIATGGGVTVRKPRF